MKQTRNDYSTNNVIPILGTCNIISTISGAWLYKCIWITVCLFLIRLKRYKTVFGSVTLRPENLHITEEALGEGTCIYTYI